jgi:Spy/CpxP family protein refolding chaperone
MHGVFTDLYRPATPALRRFATILARPDGQALEQTMTSKAASAARGERGTRVRLVMVGMVLTLLAAIGVSAWAQTPPPAPQPPMGMQGMHHGGMGGSGMMGGSPEHMGRMIDHMLDGLNASDAQRAQIKQIMAQAAADMKGQAAAARDLRRRAMEVFTAPAVDANAAEQVRLQAMQLHDQMSRRMTQAMVAAASVLTPEQRAQAGAHLKDRQARMEERMKQKEQDGTRR